MAKPLIIGTRGSDLALWQANYVKKAVEKAHPNVPVELKIVKTHGDKILDVALNKIGSKGLFTKEIEKSLLNEEIDVAVHSLKDMQTVHPDGLEFGAITKRGYPEDALVAKEGMTLETLPEGGTVGSGSLRRRALVLQARPDLTVHDVRGSVPTRLKKYEENRWDGAIFARVGLERLGLGDRIAEVLDPDDFIPAVGQGAIGVQVRKGDSRVKRLVKAIDHEATHNEALAERAFLHRLEGGCQAPIGAFAQCRRSKLSLRGIVATLNGDKVVRAAASHKITDKSPEEIGVELAEQILQTGGAAILENLETELS